MPTRHCPKHMIPLSRISIQTTSTNQICVTPYLNECKGDPNNTITTSYHIFNTWIPFGYLWSYPRNLHIPSLALALKAVGPPFPPKSAASTRWPACKGTRSEGKTVWDETIVDYCVCIYTYTSITKLLPGNVQRWKNANFAVNSEGILREKLTAPRAVLPPSDSALSLQRQQLAGAAGGDAVVPGLQVAVACLQRHVQQSNSTFI